jgi:CheY-like chemotaxis protein
MTSEKILIVDDNRDFLDELQETLYLCGYDAVTVSDSVRAVPVARKIKPDVILLDLRMSRMNGFQVAEELKRSAETSKIPIIAMSGYFPVDKQAVLLDLSRMEGRIKKPFAVLDLINQIEVALSKPGKQARQRGGA